ncbi:MULTISPECIES: hypothetical protein [unclassified Paenibacillus]|nr:MULTISPECIES: hypothetical protein [unclassified Paenibacillus]
MWKFEHSVITDAKAETNWGLYSDIDTWKEWDEFVHVEYLARKIELEAV